MKLVYIVDFPVNGNSGKSKATREKAKALGSKVGNENMTFIALKPHKSTIFKILGKITFDFKVFSKLLFKNDKYIVVQRVLFLPLTRFFLWLKGIPVISEFHADFKEEIQYLSKNRIQKKILYVLSSFFYLNFKLSDGIIFNHPYLKQKFDPLFNKPSIFSYNGSNFQEFYPIEKAEIRKQLSIPKEDIVFLFLGSVSIWHGVDYLIDIFNKSTLLNNKNIFLYIVGANDNHYTVQLKSHSVNKNIKFIPPVVVDTSRDYINASDYCLLPVKQIRTSPGSPLKLYDYISCGKPIITQQNLMGYSDEVELYNLGYTLDLTNSEEAARMIEKIALTQSSDLFLSNNRKVAVEMVSWSKRIDDWLEFITANFNK